MTFSLIFLTVITSPKTSTNCWDNILVILFYFLQDYFLRGKKGFDKLRHVGHICGKEDTHLKKQTNKQTKQEEDRKSIEKIKCSFWLENLRNFEKIWKFWKFEEIVIRLRVKKPHYSKTNSKLQGLSWHVLLRRLERSKVRFAQSFYQICHPHVLTWSCSISSRGIRFSNSSRYLI